MKNWGAALAAVAVLLVSGIFVYSLNHSSTAKSVPTPTPTDVAQLPVADQPQVQMSFAPDAHYVTVTLNNLHAAQMEYNLIYEAKVKTSRLQTGVNDSQEVEGKSTYTKKQLLGSESSGKFTYHEDIQNATLELTLRDSSQHSIFTATYPFTVTPGKTITLTASQ